MPVNPHILEVVISYRLATALGSSTDSASVTLRRYIFEPTPENPRVETARMRVEIIETENVPKELFVWEQITTFLQGKQQNRDRVLCVAKSSDLSVYPVDAPDKQNDIQPFYRTTFFDAPFESPTDMTITWRDVVSSFEKLLKALVDLGLISLSS